MKIKHANQKITSPSPDLVDYFKDFLQNHPRADFINKPQASFKKIDQILDQFKDKNHFVHIGIGGSHLGTKAIFDALGEDKITFLANLDADEIQGSLEKINLEKSIFYVVSKSGETTETIAIMNIIINKLESFLNKEIKIREHFVFCTDPKNGYLRQLAQQSQTQALDIFENVGGRFSVLSNVSYLPLAFFKKNIEEIEKTKENFFEETLKNPIPLLENAQTIFNLYKQGVNQTVLMPYSSMMKTVSSWFSQLWAESLGKVNIHSQAVGLTPICAHGSSDEHSQMQLFIEGPRNKFTFFIQVQKSKAQLIMKKRLEHKKIKLMNGLELSDILNYQLFGTLGAYDKLELPYSLLTIPEINKDNLAKVFLYFELLTVAMGHLLEINPFDQPGVELGKIEFMKNLETKPNTSKNV